MESACLACDRPLSGRARKWCSEACRVFASSNPGVKRPGPRPCAACGQTFTPIRIDQTELCSRYCQELAEGRRKYGPHGFVITCVICGKRRAVVHPSKKACHACTPEYRRRDREARKDPKARRE